MARRGGGRKIEDVRVRMETFLWIWIVGGLGLTLVDGKTWTGATRAWDNETAVIEKGRATFDKGHISTVGISIIERQDISRVEGKTLNEDLRAGSNERGSLENRQGHFGRENQDVVTLLRDSNAVVFKAWTQEDKERCPGILLYPQNKYKFNSWTKNAPKFCKSWEGRVCIQDLHTCLSRWGNDYRAYWRSSYYYEGRKKGRCRTTEEGDYYTHPTIFVNGITTIDLLLLCRSIVNVRTHYCERASIFKYWHQWFNLIESYGIPEEKLCPGYCIGFAKLTKKSNTYTWEIGTKCPKTDIDPKECPSNNHTFVGTGDNQWCYNSTHYDKIEAYYSSNLTATVTRDGEKRLVKAVSANFKRKCGAFICNIGYCLRKGKEIICGNEGKHFDPNDESDPRRDCFFKTEHGSSLRLSETEWCCRDPNGCANPVGKCTQKSDCFADYCISHGDETRCPSNEEAKWSECMDVRWGETLRIPRRGIWCCVPAYPMLGCNLEIRACGSNLSCSSPFCIGEQAFGKIETKCPEDEDASADACKGLTGDQELRLSTQKVCCNKVECHGKVIACGNDRSCADDFCLAFSDFQGVNIETKCPPPELDHVNRYKCSALSEFQTVRIDEKFWCCKARNCSTSVDSSTSSSTAVIEPELTTRMRKEREKKSMRGPVGLQSLFWILIVANIFVVVFGGGGLVAYYLRLKRKRRERDLWLSEDSDKTSDQLTAEIEEALGAELEKKTNTRESPSISTNKTTSAPLSKVPAQEETEGTTALSQTQSLCSISQNVEP